ncbi:MAG: CCA tRNA nucleotidyltransferase [Planctomycetota bacterium]
MPRIDITTDLASDPRLHAAADVAAQLRAAGWIGYFAGGCVRDWLRGLHPKDIDIVTSATPQEIRRVFPRAQDVGEAFGVMLVRHRGFTFEVATFRSDGSYSDGRRPDEVILHSSPEEDAARRDFSINGMFLDPATGDVIDFVGGAADLAAGLIRAIGDPAARFGEDQLRLMRAVRFAAQTGYTIEPATWAAMCTLAPKLETIAKERVHDEMTRFLVGPRPDEGLRLAADSGLLQVAVPAVSLASVVHAVAMLRQLRDDRIEPPGNNDDDDDPREPWRHMRDDGAHWNTPTLAWACVLHDLAYRDAEAMIERLKMSNAHRDRILHLLADRDAHTTSLATVRDLPLAALKRLLRRPGIDEHIAHFRLHRLASDDAVDCCRFALRRLHEIEDAPDPADRLRPPMLLDGHALQGLGYVPGPAFKQMLELLESAQLAGELRTRDAAVKLVRARFPLERR